MALALFENIGLALASGVPAYMEAKKLAMDAREAAQQRRAAKVMAALEDQEFAAKNRLDEMKRISDVFYDTYMVVPGTDGQYSVPSLFGEERVTTTPEQRDYRLSSLETQWRLMAAGFREDFPQYANAVYLRSPMDQARQIDLTMESDLGVTGETTPETTPETTTETAPTAEPTGTGFDFEGAGEMLQPYLGPYMRALGKGVYGGLNVLSHFLPTGPGGMYPADQQKEYGGWTGVMNQFDPSTWFDSGPASQPDTLGSNAIEGPYQWIYDLLQSANSQQGGVPEPAPQLEEEEDLDRGLEAYPHMQPR